jgi:hypothetical protein
VLTISRAALLAATLSLSAPALSVLPAVAQDMQQPDFNMSLEISEITAVGSSMSEDQLRDVFTSNFLEHADELARLTATSITIPEIKFSMIANDGTTDYSSSIVYRDTVFTNIKDGYAESVVYGAMESVSTDGTTRYEVSTQDGFDIRRTLELLGMVKGDASAAMKPLYNSYVLSGGTHEGPLYTCSFGEATGTKAEARPAKYAFSDVLKTITDVIATGTEPSPEAIGTVVSYATDVLRAFRGGAAEIGAVDCTIPAPEGEITFKLAGAGMSDFEPAVYPELRVNGVAVDAGEAGSGSLGEFVFKPLDLNPTIDALDSAQGQLSEEWFEANWRQLIPSWEGLSFADFAIDVVTPAVPADASLGMPARPGERVKASVANFDLSLGEYFLGIPTDVSMTSSGIEIPLPQDSTDPQINTLLAAGLTGVNMGFDLAAAWDRDGKAIALEELAIAALDLGSLSISANVGNATEQLFDVDPNVAMVAGFGLMVKDVTINATDDGLGAILWPLVAAEQGQTDVEAFRLQMAGMFEGMAIQLIGPTDAARQLGAAIGEFAAGGKSEITITIKAKDPNGIPLAMFMAAQNDPTILTGQVDITGMAN